MDDGSWYKSTEVGERLRMLIPITVINSVDFDMDTVFYWLGEKVSPMQDENGYYIVFGDGKAQRVADNFPIFVQI
jgi:hypothetical protein